MTKVLLRSIGLVGSVGWIYIFATNFSFPTPDKLLLLALFLGLFFGQAFELMKRLLPFIALLYLYDLFRGFADYLNTHVNYMWMPQMDKLLAFGQLPTTYLQNVLWHGQVRWFDILLYGFYMMHYVFPLILAILIWKFRDNHYLRFATAYVLVSFAGFITFVLFPAAPPWMASDMHLIENVHRVSSDVWWAMGVHDFPSLYGEISPNAVAAVPSLHAAYATMFCLFIFRYFKKSKLKYLSLSYPLAIYFGTVYMAEHYLVDEIIGALYGLVAFKASEPVAVWLKNRYAKIVSRLDIKKRLAYVFASLN